MASKLVYETRLKTTAVKIKIKLKKKTENQWSTRSQKRQLTTAVEYNFRITAIITVTICLQCFDICWLSIRKSIWPVKKLGDEVLVWLSAAVCSEVKMTCIRSSWCHCHPIISCFINIHIGLTFLVPVYHAVLEKRLLNRCLLSLWEAFTIITIPPLF